MRIGRKRDSAVRRRGKLGKKSKNNYGLKNVDRLIDEWIDGESKGV